MSVRAPYLTARRLAVTTAVLAWLLAVSIVCAALVGPVAASPWRAFAPGGASTPDYVILVRTRLPRVLLGAVVGGSLGASGAALQALLRNPLACPHLLGISGGAAVAASSRSSPARTPCPRSCRSPPSSARSRRSPS